MLRGSGRTTQRARTTIGSLRLSKSLLRTLLKRPLVSRKTARFRDGATYQPGHLAEFCRKCSPCLRSTGVSWSGNPTCSIKEVARDSCSSARLGTHRHSGDDPQPGRGTQANARSDGTSSQGASSDSGEGVTFRGTSPIIGVTPVGRRHPRRWTPATTHRSWTPVNAHGKVSRGRSIAWHARPCECRLAEADDQREAYSIPRLWRPDRNDSLASFLRPDLTPPERAVAHVEGCTLGVP